MKWLRPEIEACCLPTEQVDPRQRPNDAFVYVDISGVDRTSKLIASTTRLVGSEAPSRARKLIRKEDVLVSTVRPNLNAVAMVPAELDGQIASTGFCVLRSQRNLTNPRYLFYFVQHQTFIDALCAQMRGANYPAVSDGTVKSVALPLPPPSEQRRIVELLDQADALRKQRAEADQLADRILPALFLKMFGDPIGLAGRGDARPLASWGIEVQNGFACGDKDVADGLPHMRMNNIDDHGRLNLDLIRTVPRDYADEKYELRDGDVLFMGTNSEEKVGKCCVFSPPDHRRWFYSNHLARMRNSEMHSTPEFLAVYLHQLWRAGFYRSRMKRWVNQAAMNTDAIRAIPLSPVNIELAKEFSCKYRIINTMHERRASAEAAMKMQFEVMLNRAFTGDLTAKWREAHLKELLQEMEQQARYLRQSAVERIEA